MSASIPSRASNTDRSAAADRDVETVWLPVEIVAQRPEEVVEVGDLVAQVLDVATVWWNASTCSWVAAELACCKRTCCFRMSMVLEISSACLEQVRGAVLLVAEVHDLAGALRADLKRNGAVGDRGAQGPGDRLHQGDTGGMQDGLGDALEDQHVRRVAHVVIGLDHQQFGVEPGLREVAFRGRVADVGRARSGR